MVREGSFILFNYIRILVISIQDEMHKSECGRMAKTVLEAGIKAINQAWVGGMTSLWELNSMGMLSFGY